MGDKRTPDTLAKAKNYFDQAIGKDPGYALAYVGLAEYYSVLPVYTYTSANECNPRLKSAASKALSIDDNQPRPMLCWQLLTTLILNGPLPNGNLNARCNSGRVGLNVLYGLHFQSIGKQEEAFAHFQRGIQLDPVNLNAMSNLGGMYLFTGQYDQAVNQLNKTLEIDPNFAWAHVVLGITYQLQGKYDLWFEEWEKAGTLNHDDDDLAVKKAVQAELSRSGYRAALAGFRRTI